ncbi:MAG TPA: hypothetical protein VFA07_13805 [Chthonomonadaceae bacterium]|nr:hypothetical protein [Chthonomonadaceae bacterium]
MVPPSRLTHAGRGRTALRVLIVCGLLWVATSVYGLPAAHAVGLRIAEGAPHASLWKRIYDRIPDPWKIDRPLLVREISDGEMDALVERSGGNKNPEDASTVVDGCYLDGGDNEDDPASITLRETLNEQSAGIVFAHEYGHYVWANMLTEDQRARFARLWRTQKRAHHLVTGYASYSVEEGFAESFSYLVMRPEILRRRDSASWQFLQSTQAARAAQLKNTPDADREP